MKRIKLIVAIYGPARGLKMFEVSGFKVPEILSSTFCDHVGISERFRPDYEFPEGVMHFAKKRGYEINYKELK